MDNFDMWEAIQKCYVVIPIDEFVVLKRIRSSEERYNPWSLYYPYLKY